MWRRRPHYPHYSLFTTQTDMLRLTESMNLLKHDTLYQECWSFKMENYIFMFKYSKRIIYCGTRLD